MTGLSFLHPFPDSFTDLFKNYLNSKDKKIIYIGEKENKNIILS